VLHLRKILCTFNVIKYFNSGLSAVNLSLDCVCVCVCVCLADSVIVWGHLANTHRQRTARKNRCGKNKQNVSHKVKRKNLQCKYTHTHTQIDTQTP